ncbi:MAG TPA: acyltransferase domain-containing protein, partial [Solirubrobacteraceae bacterium]
MDTVTPAILPCVLSGSGATALRAQAQRLREYVESRPGLGVAEVGFSLTFKPRLPDRAVVLAGSREQLLDGLGSLTRNERAPGLIEGAASAEGDGGTVWVFPGQGSQWAGMAADLFEHSPVFRRSLLACQDALAPFVDWSLEDVLCAR